MPFVFLLYALFASVFTISKTALAVSSPFFLIAVRMTIAGMLMLGYLLLFDRKALKISSKSLLLALALGLVNIYITNVCEYWGLQYLTSFKTCFIYSLSPFVSALLSYFLLKESLTRKKWLGLAIGFMGFLPVLLTQGASEALSGEFFFFSFAELAVITAAVSSVLGWILLSKLMKEESVNPLTANGLSMLFGGLLAFVHSFSVESWNPAPVSNWLTFAECSFALLVISNLLAYNLYGHLLKKYSPTFMSLAGFTTPLFTVLFGWIFLGEVASISFYISAVVVFAGLSIYHQEELATQIVTSNS